MNRPENQTSTNLPLIVLGLLGAAVLAVAVFVVGGAFLGWFSAAQIDRGGLAVGESAPALHAEGWINGEPPSLDGKIVVVEAWTST